MKWPLSMGRPSQQDGCSSNAAVIQTNVATMPSRIAPCHQSHPRAHSHSPPQTNNILCILAIGLAITLVFKVVFDLTSRQFGDFSGDFNVFNNSYELFFNLINLCVVLPPPFNSTATGVIGCDLSNLGCVFNVIIIFHEFAVECETNAAHNTKCEHT